jgi:PTS system fructose-specific IIA component
MQEENYLSIINEQAVEVGVAACDKETVFEHVARRLEQIGVLTSSEHFKKDLYERESQGPTGIGGGIAIPHGKSLAVKNTCISIVKLEQPIQWESFDDEPVQIVILFAVSLADKNNKFLSMMAQVARKLANEEVCLRLAAAATPQELIQALGAA